MLEATEDTFHYNRCGQLRPAEAAELLKALRAVEFQLRNVRQHAEFFQRPLVQLERVFRRNSFARENFFRQRVSI